MSCSLPINQNYSINHYEKNILEWGAEEDVKLEKLCQSGKKKRDWNIISVQFPEFNPSISFLKARFEGIKKINRIAKKEQAKIEKQQKMEKYKASKIKEKEAKHTSSIEQFEILFDDELLDIDSLLNPENYQNKLFENDQPFKTHHLSSESDVNLELGPLFEIVSKSEWKSYFK